MSEEIQRTVPKSLNIFTINDKARNPMLTLNLDLEGLSDMVEDRDQLLAQAELIIATMIEGEHFPNEPLAAMAAEFIATYKALQDVETDGE